MKNYKEFKKERIGCSDIASLIFVFIDKEQGLTSKILGTGFDGCYESYVIEGEAKIGSHYELMIEAIAWLKIYDDDSLTYEVKADAIKVYQAGGTFIIQTKEKEV